MKRKNLETYEFEWTEEIENEKGELIEVIRITLIYFSFTIEESEYENGYAYYQGGVIVEIWDTEGDEMDEWTENEAEEEIEKMLTEEYC